MTAYPMKAEKKKAREELDIVNVIEWHKHAAASERWFLLVRRPEGGEWRLGRCARRMITARGFWRSGGACTWPALSCSRVSTQAL